MPTITTPDLITDLRASTRALHAQIEAAVDIESRLATGSGYAALLAGLHGLHAGFEDALASVPGLARVRPPIDLGARRRSPLLAADLTELGVAVPATAPIPADAVPGDVAGALGCLYVLEGSARGGAVIAAMAVERFGPTVARRGLEGDDPVAARVRWHGLLATLAAYGAESDEDERGRVIAAAQATFRAFEAGLTPQGGGR